jgi:hypothetical protein
MERTGHYTSVLLFATVACMAAALCMTWLPGNKVAEDKDRFTNYNINTHVSQITTGLQNDKKTTDKTEGFYIMDFCSSINEARGFPFV